MATTSSRVSSHTILQLTVGLFFIVLGIAGIIPQAGEGMFGFSKNITTLEIVFGVVELACGLFFLVDAFRRVPNKVSAMITVIILLLWLARFVINEIVNGIDINSSGIVFHPSFWAWMLAVATDLLVAGAVWTLFKDE